MKYAALLTKLDDYQVYTPRSIAEWAEETGQPVFAQEAETSPERVKARIRRALAYLARSRRFPADGDGRVKQGNRFYPAWWGWRWQAAMDPKTYL